MRDQRVCCSGVCLAALGWEAEDFCGEDFCSSGSCPWQGWNVTCSALATPAQVNVFFHSELGSLLSVPTAHCNHHKHQFWENYETVPFPVKFYFTEMTKKKWLLHRWDLHNVDKEREIKVFLAVHILIEFWCCLFEALRNENIWKLIMHPLIITDGMKTEIECFTPDLATATFYCKLNDQRCVLPDDFYKLCLKLWQLWNCLQNSHWPQWGRTTKLSLRVGELRSFEELPANPGIIDDLAPPTQESCTVTRPSFRISVVQRSTLSGSLELMADLGDVDPKLAQCPDEVPCGCTACLLAGKAAIPLSWTLFPAQLLPDSPNSWVHGGGQSILACCYASIYA